ncbi:MAG: hypothetical protein AAFS11_01280 [Planctomycetota bacterium]
MLPRTAPCLLVAGSAAAQPDMLVTVEDFNGDDSWSITAEFLTTPPSPIVQVWADASFALVGDGSPITITDYNPSYDTTLTDAVITDNGTDRVDFVGNANAFFGTPDSSNPLFVASFDYTGNMEDVRLFLIGQNSAIFEDPPFGDVRLYQDVNPDPRLLLTFEIQIVPAPAVLAFAPFTAIALRRRR